MLDAVEELKTGLGPRRVGPSLGLKGKGQGRELQLVPSERRFLSLLSNSDLLGGDHIWKHRSKKLDEAL